MQFGGAKASRKQKQFFCAARELHHDNALLEFNLACYASVIGGMGEARSRLRRAIELDKALRKLALDDEDLKPLWDWIATLE